ncbi:murein biosynthesis integral membrane protein MurJ [Streptomyces avicenniae]|uniref:murein biosynthesis integral membrane protein MurJ n=1 Tax=Streptomyces avicenniae TaxID=500153 RepID=UPI000ABFDFAF|nr:murein biosynthesis integral membrane protein MurJ [Streptomyces avicenniae]
MEPPYDREDGQAPGGGDPSDRRSGYPGQPRQPGAPGDVPAPPPGYGPAGGHGGPYHQGAPQQGGYAPDGYGAAGPPPGAYGQDGYGVAPGSEFGAPYDPAAYPQGPQPPHQPFPPQHAQQYGGDYHDPGYQPYAGNDRSRSPYGAGQASHEPPGAHPGYPQEPYPYGHQGPGAGGQVPDGYGQQYGGPQGRPYGGSGIDGLMNMSGEQPPGPGGPGHRPDLDDAFAHLFRDQQSGSQPYPPQTRQGQHQDQGPPAPQGRQHVPPGGPPAEPYPRDESTGREAAEAEQPDRTAPAKKPGRATSLLRSSAVMAAGTLVSRLTGFVRQLVIVAALGAAVLGDTYTVAWALPNMIYILTIGGGLNSVFVPQLVRSMRNDRDGGDAYANRLLTLVMVILGALVVVAVFAAPLLVRLMSAKIADDPAANDVAVTFARYFLPTIFFMGIHVVLGQILNARDHFGPMMWTPVLNNIVVIFTCGMFLWVYGTQRTSGVGVTTITPEGIRLLGVGTLLGLVVQALAMLPYLRAAGFRVRPRFDWRGHGMGKAAKLAKWTVLFVLANQAGLVVVTQFATWAGDDAERAGYPGTGFIAYNSALLIWQMPQAIITVSVMAALLPRLSRSAADGDAGAVRDDLSHGLRTSAVAIVPIAFAFVALGVPMCTLLFGAAGEDGARSFGYILMAFGLGLIPFSAQYVVLRAFYAYEDTRTPFYNTVIVSLAWIVLSAICFLALPDRWVVAGIALSYGLAYAIGVRTAWRRLRRRMRADLDGSRIVRTYIRLAGASIPAALAGGAVGFVVLGALGEGFVGSLAALAAGGLILLGIFYVAARRMRVEELTALVGMIRGRLGR